MNTMETMSDAVDIAEFPFMASLPKREKTRVQKVFEHLAQVKEAIERKGMLIPVAFAAKILDVSKQRVDQLMKEGILERIEVDGHPFVTEDSVVAFAKTERKAGRPPKFIQDCEDKGPLRASIEVGRKIYQEAKEMQAAKKKT